MCNCNVINTYAVRVKAASCLMWTKRSSSRRKTLLPLDDLYDLLVPEIPALTRSNLHRCL
jgi:hypothetical protein